jgi:hypothetical protein
MLCFRPARYADGSKNGILHHGGIEGFFNPDLNRSNETILPFSVPSVDRAFNFPA